MPAGLRLQARFGDGDVFAVTAGTPSVYTARITAFSAREYNDDWTWRWMGTGASWRIVNTGARPVAAAIGVELSAFHRQPRMELRLDGRPVQALVIEPLRLATVVTKREGEGQPAGDMCPCKVAKKV